MSILELLVEDLEEDLYAWGEANLYEFSWSLRGMGKGLSEEEIGELCQQAYDRLTQRFALHLEWYDWPPRSLRRADPGTELDFDLYNDGERALTIPYLVLVPDDPAATSAELERQFHPDGPPEKRRWWSGR